MSVIRDSDAISVDDILSLMPCCVQQLHHLSTEDSRTRWFGESICRKTAAHVRGCQPGVVKTLPATKEPFITQCINKCGKVVYICVETLMEKR